MALRQHFHFVTCSPNRLDVDNGYYNIHVCYDDSSLIQRNIYYIRGVPVILDVDLARLYRVPTKRLNEQVRRNIGRFPEEFCFKLKTEEYEALRSQFATLDIGHTYLPYAFTEQGVAMLSAVLRSDVAVYMSIRIMNAFVAMRKVIADNSQIVGRLDRVERKQLETDQKFDKVFDALSGQKLVPAQKIFFENQIFDAHEFVSKIIKSANKRILLLDNYIDESVLTLFTKRKPNVEVIIYSKDFNLATKLDLDKFKAQYGDINFCEFDLSHDRFLIIDDDEIYHFGASLKDLGKKWFAVSKFEKQALLLLDKLGRI